MSPVNEFEFELFRINLVHEAAGLEMGFRHFQSDADIASTIETACSSQDLFEKDPTGSAYYQWRLADSLVIPAEDSEDLGLIVCFKLVRETFRKSGATVTPEGRVKDVDTEMKPPLATVAQIVCFMDRHLAVIEHCSELMGSAKWKAHLENLLAKAASSSSFNTKIHFEAKPKRVEVMEAFESFHRLTRLKVTLLLPNPDLPRFGEALYERMKAGGVRRYVQDMSNPDGLVREKGELPYAAIALAEAGYKDGEVELTGELDGQVTTRKTGGVPDRGRLDLLKSYVRGLKKGTSKDDAHKCLRAILTEISRLETDA